MGFYQMVGLVVLMCLLACEQSELSDSSFTSGQSARLNGVNYSQTHLLPEEGIDLEPISGNWVALIPQYFGNQGQTLITQVHRWERIIPTSIEQAQEKGLAIMIKPHIDFNQNRIFRGEFTLENEEDWQLFEEAYSERILELVSIAEQYQVEAFCVGTELRLFALKRSDYWRNLIAQIRERFSGQLVYAANWDEYHEIPFWDQLDFIGVNAYFPLTKTPIPQPQELHLGWVWYKDALRHLAEETGKPILFTEYGYRSIEQATWKHWELGIGNPSESVQALGYDIFFQTFWEEPWVAGGLIWEWVPNPPRGSNTRWTPQGKLAEEVIGEWYKK